MDDDFLHALLKFFEKEPFSGISHAVAVQFQDKVLWFELPVVEQAEYY